MLNSTIEVLSQYLNTVSRYNIYSMEMIRSNNPDELHYLCEVDNSYYIVVEADYIGDLSSIANAMVQSFSYLPISPLHWLVKKADQASLKKSVIAHGDHADVNSNRSSLITKTENTFYKYAVLEVKYNESKQPPFNPTKYGYADSKST